MDNRIVQSLGSQYKRLIGSDYVKSIITAFFTAFFSTAIITLIPLFKGTDLPTWVDVRTVIIASISAGLGALGRKYFTNSMGQPFKKEPTIVIPSQTTDTNEKQ